MAQDVTRLLRELTAGDQRVLPALLGALQVDLRSIAAAHLARERRDHTLQPTALVNEAYLRLVDQRDQGWEGRRHFLAIASTAMRRVLLEHARARLAEKRGGGAARVELFEVETAFDEEPEALVALDEALQQLAEIDPENARIVELRFFGGLSVEEVASIEGVSTRTIERGWRAARAWLRDRIGGPLA
jgi:RNA polymerase sigma-70 factor (ECF subfamily)